MATLVELQRQLEVAQLELRRLNDQATALAAQYAAAGYPTGGALYDSVVANSLARKEVATQIDTLTIQISQINSSGTSAGNIVQNDDAATVPNASIQRPQSPPQVLDNGRIRPPPDTTSGTNAQVSPTPDAVDFGTDDELRPTIITQGTPAQTVPPAAGSTGVLTQPAPPQPGGSPGAAAPGDDGLRLNTTQQEIDITFNSQPIVPKDNILDQYASYTYTASVYLMSKAAANTMFSSKQKNLAGSQLLFQSGGAPVGGRNEFFSNDYYIDTIQLDSVIAGKGSNWSHNVAQARMTVIEPNGITLLDNLERAVNGYLNTVNQGQSQNKKLNYQAELYLLVIRFYGYDVNGNLVRGGVPSPDGSSDPNAFVEKWYPLRINQIRFRVASRLVQYDIEATVAQFDLGAGSTRGTIPYNLELSGKTVKDVLTGPVGYSKTANQLDQEAIDLRAAYGDINATSILQRPAPEKVNAAPSTSLTIRQGLFTALNDYQAKLVEQGIQDVADIYEVVFESNAIASAEIKRGGTGSLDKTATSMPVPNNASTRVNPKKTSMDGNTRIKAIVAGQQIVTVIDQVIRNSTYIENQQLYKVNEETGQTEPTGNAAARSVAWFKVSFSATPLEFDSKRHDYAFRMRFNISAYKINNAPPPWFPQPRFNGVHKQYYHWFTGQNTQVLNFEQTYNANYHLVLSGGLSQLLAQQTSNRNELQKYSFAPRSSESSQDAKGRTNEPAANLADYLYSPGDQSKLDMTIVGDPSWLQQGEAFAGLDPRNPNRYSAFLADGTINFDSEEVLFEVAFNKPTDYDLTTGLMDTGKNNYNANRAAGQAGNAQQSYIYLATRVSSMFEKGKFTQRLQGVQRHFPTSAQQNYATNQAGLREQAQVNASNQRLGAGISSVLGPILSTPQAGSNPNNPVNTGTLITSAIQKVLGTQPSGPYTPPYVPTSSGQPIGTVNTPTIDPTTGQPISANERVVGVGATPDIDTQIGAAGDDAYDPGNYSSSEEALNRDFGQP